MNLQQSESLFSQAQNHIPGGVNSPVRAFKAVGGNPIFIKSAKGAYLYDEDGNEFIELINSWGPMILGHAHPLITDAVQKAVVDSPSFGGPTRKEVEIAELICSMVPSVEKVRMVNSGTEATMSAIRVARGYTGRDKIIKFEGCYHGHGDSFLIAAGSGAATMGQPDSPGVTAGTAKDTLTAPYNDLSKVTELVENNKGQVAAIIIEPVAGNMGLILPKEGYLQGLRKLCSENGIVLVFDEVMSGFRLAKGGAQELYDVTPDLTTLGKVIGGGLPVGAYGGKKEIMNFVSPAGPVYQAGTLSGNPIAMSAGLALLTHLDQHPEVYSVLEEKGKKMAAGFRQNIADLGVQARVEQLGSMICLFFTDSPVHDFSDAKKSNLDSFKQYFNSMLHQGIYLAPAQFESLFLSTALSDTHIEQIVLANRKALKTLVNVG